ncbi:hypothetical protein T484DRAFT_1839830 [Baffinella frigidus]|nr:hypothetical protein T484DRAFT_1839830 [Cryptophyta sp. CCMP2293]
MPKPRHMRGRADPLGTAAVVLAACSNSLFSPFLLDDLTKVRDNPDIRSLSPAALIYPYSDVASQNVRRNDPSRPLVFFSFALNHFLLGPSPWHFRAVNILLHFCDVCLL